MVVCAGEEPGEDPGDAVGVAAVPAGVGSADGTSREPPGVAEDGRKRQESKGGGASGGAHGFLDPAGCVSPGVDQASDAGIAGSSPPRNGFVTGSSSVNASPPPGRADAASEPPRSWACSAAMARPIPELPLLRDASAL